MQRILRGVHVPIDVFKLKIPHKDASRGDEEVYCFNSLHWGLASKVNVTAEKLRWMGKAARYTAAAFMEVFSGSQTLATVLMEEADGSVREYHEEFSLIIANNIKGAAKGMQIAPNAKLNDGLIDLLLIRSDRPLDLLTIFDKFYKVRTAVLRCRANLRRRRARTSTSRTSSTVRCASSASRRTRRCPRREPRRCAPRGGRAWLRS